MFTRPTGLSDTDVAAALGAGWELNVDAISYADVGFGSHHWRVEAAGSNWFVTVDDLDAKRMRRDEPLDVPLARLTSALTTAHALRSAGLGFVVAPIPTLAGAIVRRIDVQYAVALYPHVEGTSHPWGPYPTSAERTAVVDLLTALHRAPPSACASTLVDDLAIASRDDLTAGLAEHHEPWDRGPFGEPARLLLQQHADAVRRALERYDAVATRVARRSDRWVLTHGEPHRGNTIITASGTVLIDWDTTLIAPPERDLWSLVGEDGAVAEQYAGATGVTPDRDALELYTLRWELTDISIFVGEFRRPHGDTEDARAAWTSLQTYLDPTRWELHD